MRKFNLFILLFLFGVSLNIIYAQAINNFKNEVAPRVFSNSPTANSLGNFGQVPVNLFTGQPQISIELYRIKESGFEMPISLNYNLASVKPDEHPGWTGLGWNLNVGGAITRIIRGGVDEVMVPNIGDAHVFSYYDNHSTLSETNWDSDSKMVTYINSLSNLMNGIATPSPDEFVFNVDGLSGSFFLDHNGNWVVKANQNIDIKVNESIAIDYKFYEEAYTPNDISTYYKDFIIKRIFYGFELTTDNGTKYVFGKSPYSIEFTSSPKTPGADDYNSNFIAKTWYLTKVILPNQSEINFEYISDATLPNQPIDGAVYYKAVFKSHVSTNYVKYDTTHEVHESSSTKRNLERMYNVYLNKITTTNSIINFNRSISNDLDYDLTHTDLKWIEFQSDGYTGDMNHYKNNYLHYKHWYKLDDIIVKSIPNNQRIYKVAFNYLENPTSRLFLKDIKEYEDINEIDINGNVTNGIAKNHFFSYNETPLPSYNSRMVDHWGFYNNSVYTGNFIEVDLRNNYANSKNPNPVYMKAGVLTDIQYPTGGFTSIQYEPHSYSKTISKSSIGGISVINASSNNEMAGGLRVSSILSFGGATPVITRYYYQNDYIHSDTSSSGVLSGIPEYFEGYGNSGAIPYLVKLIDNPAVFMNNTSGSHVTYSKVVEKQSNFNSTQFNGLTEYSYSNQDNGFIDLNPNNTLNHISTGDNAINFTSSPLVNRSQSYNELGPERGKLLNEKKYNSSFKLLEESKYFYNADPSRLSNEIRCLDYTDSKYGDMVHTDYYSVYIVELNLKFLTAYKIYTHQTYLERVENYKYDLTNNTNLVTQKILSYSDQNGFHQLKQEKQYNSIDEPITTDYYYCKDMEMLTQPFVNELFTKNMVGIPLKIESYKNNTKLFEKLTQYDFDSTNNLLLPKQILAKKGDESTISLERVISYDFYDNKGNIKQYTIEDALPVSILWGYNQSQPIAKIEGLSYSSLPATYVNAAILASNTGSETDLLNALSALRTNVALSNAMVTTYTYKPLIGISTITDPKGDAQYYFYDSFNRLSYVKDLYGNILSENKYHYRMHH